VGPGGTRPPLNRAIRSVAGSMCSHWSRLRPSRVRMVTSLLCTDTSSCRSDSSQDGEAQQYLWSRIPTLFKDPQRAAAQAPWPNSRCTAEGTHESEQSGL
jgi:hypothetical protein